MELLKLNNDDIFISYSRYDARTYTDGLANELTKIGFSCFTDALGSDAGKEVPESLIRKLKACTMLVVVGSPNAATSIAVGKEIENYSLAKGTSTIVLIDFDDAIIQAFWQSFVIGLRREKEGLMALETGNPTPAIVSRIEKAFSYRKNKDRLKWYTQTAISVLILLMIAIAGASYFASIQLKKAKLQQQIANSLDLANESQAMLQDPKLIVSSVDKAVQSMEIDFAAGRHSLIPDLALRSSLSLLADLKDSKEYPGKAFFLRGTVLLLRKDHQIPRKPFTSRKKIILSLKRMLLLIQFFRLATIANMLWVHLYMLCTLPIRLIKRSNITQIIPMKGK